MLPRVEILSKQRNKHVIQSPGSCFIRKPFVEHDDAHCGTEEILPDISKCTVPLNCLSFNLCKDLPKSINLSYSSLTV